MSTHERVVAHLFSKYLNRLTAVVLAVGLLLPPSSTASATSTRAQPPATPAAVSVPESHLPAVLRYRLSAEAGRDNPVYHFAGTESAVTTTHPRMGFAARAEGLSLSVDISEESWRTSVERWGRPTA